MEELKFADFCNVCEKVRSHKTKQKAGETLQKFVDYIMNGNPDTFFPILRLLLPQLDRERGPYGVKETNLAKIYKRILGLAPNSLEARTLSNFNSPSAITSGAMGDFAEVLSCILKNRCGNGNVMTIIDVNKCLDNIALKHAQNDPRAVDDEFSEMVNKMSSHEQKWVVRIVLKSMDLRLGHKKILSIYHPDANEVYILSNSILKVCEKLKSRNVRFYELGIELFQPFRPMLCERADVHTLTISKPYFVETKMDGERFQIHYKDHSFKYFSRNGYDYSDCYGSSPDVGHFTSLVIKQFSADLSSCILDGEMMGWHPYKKKFVTKGGNIDVKQLRVGSTLQPCFCVFDIILYNDVMLTNMPFSERIKVVEKVFTPLEGVIMHVKRCTISNIQEAFDALNEAIDNNEEGIIVKDPLSFYIPNSRKSEWRKFKPDYSEGTSDLDLLIIGGYYGSGRRKGMICHFLLGVSEKSSGDPEKFMSIAKVSSGISDEELDELRAKLDPYWIKFKAPTPSFMLLKREKPDVFINPRNSVILQVKSPEVVRSDIYYTEYTLRFPRVERIRYDKLWHDCLKIDEFIKLRTYAEGKLTVGHILPGTSKRKRKFDNKDVSEAPAVKVDRISDLFSGKELCIMNGGQDFSKDELEKMVLQHGGSVVNHPTSSTFCVIFSEENIRIRNVIRSKKHNVAKHLWLIDSIKEDRLIPWSRQNLVSFNLRTEAMISEQYDSYGDKHFEPLTFDGLKNIFCSMKSIPLSHEKIKEVDKLLFDGPSPFSLFRNHYAYFDLLDSDLDYNVPGIKLRNTMLIYRFNAGTVCDKLNPMISHVIMDERFLHNLLDIKNECEKNNISCVFVSYRWIIDSYRSKMIKNNEEYAI